MVGSIGAIDVRLQITRGEMGMRIRHWGSTASIVLGILLFVSSAAAIQPGGFRGGLVSGPVMILAGLACRSAKTRNFGVTKHPLMRKILEPLLIAGVGYLWLGQSNLKYQIATDPISSLVVSCLGNQCLRDCAVAQAKSRRRTIPARLIPMRPPTRGDEHALCLYLRYGNRRMNVRQYALMGGGARRSANLSDLRRL